MKKQKKVVILNRVVLVEGSGSETSSTSDRESKEEYVRSVKRLDQLEDAASIIQKNFRRKNAQGRGGLGRGPSKKSLMWNIDEESDTSESHDCDESEEGGDKDRSGLFTLAFVALGSLAMVFYSTFSCCFEKVFGRSNADEDVAAAEAMDFTEASMTHHSAQQTTNATTTAQSMPLANGGGGGPAPSPGAESMAANAAASAVASGVGSGIAVGAAAGAGSTGGLAGTIAGASTVTQVVAAMAVAAAVSTATFTGVELMNTESALSQFPSVVSTCGVEDPDIRKGNFTLTFEGLQREIAEREVFLFENLVVTAYNNLTRGEYNQTTGTYTCVDEYLREMQQSSMIRQIFVGEDVTEDGVSSLQIDLDAEILCKGCPAFLPIFGTIEEERLRRRYLRQLEEKEMYDVSFIEVYLMSIIEALFELMNMGELPRAFTPSMVYFRPFNINGLGGGGQSDQNLTLDDQGGDNENGLFEVTIPVGTYDDKINDEILPIFPTDSVNGEVEVDFFEGNFEMIFSGFDLTRSFTEEEIVLIEKLFVEAYNKQTATFNDGATDGDVSSIREMAQANLIEQLFTDGGDGPSTLEITFNSFITCQACPEDEALFGMIGGGEEDLDLNLIQSVLKDVVLGVIDLINTDDLPDSFLMDEVFVVDTESNKTDLVSIPVQTTVDENGNIIADLPDVGLSPEIYNGEFEISFRGFEGEFNEEESKLIENMLVEAYNKFTLGEDTSSMYLREMLEAALSSQDFEEGDGSSSSVLDLTLDVSVICQDCPGDQPVFGISEGDSEPGLLDWKFIEAVMANIIDLLVGNINGDELPPSFLPEEIFLNTNTTGDFLVSIPVNTYFDETTGQFVFELEPTIIDLPSNSPSISSSPTDMPSSRPSLSALPSKSPSNTPSISVQPSVQASSSPTVSASPSDAPSPQPSLSLLPTLSPTVRASRIPTPIPSVSPTAAPSADPTVSPTAFPTFRPSPSPTSAPSPIPSEYPSASPSTSPSSEPSLKPSSLDSEVPSSSPSAAPTNLDSLGPTITASSRPSSLDSVQPSSSPSTSSPTDSPTAGPTNTPTSGPTNAPTSHPTSAPTAAPTSGPTSAPTSQPTSAPSAAPVEIPTSFPPTSGPTSAPTSQPTSAPSAAPVEIPTSFSPTSGPTSAPTSQPTAGPTDIPSSDPSRSPTLQPTELPTSAPTSGPTDSPTLNPTVSPTSGPTSAPTNKPVAAVVDRYVTCGATAGDGACAGIVAEYLDPTATTLNGLPIAVRCCADSATPGFSLGNQQAAIDCPRVASKFQGQCFDGFNYADAEAKCIENSGRLCTQVEMEAGCTDGSGCNFESSPVWTSTTE